MYTKLKEYRTNSFLLLIPIFIWNIIFISYLPEAYNSELIWDAIPISLKITENILRLLVFTLPLFMKFTFDTRKNKVGLYIYLIGVFIYFSSWIFQFLHPGKNWNMSILGFMAPAFTTTIWFFGIYLVSKPYKPKFRYLTTTYLCLSLAFIFAHSLHAFIVFGQLK